jgi:diguanylate cyclase (GGDEF)-like protein
MNATERALRTLSAANRTLLRASDETQLLQDMCRVIVEVGGYRTAWIGYAEQDAEKTITPVAYAGYDGRVEDAPRFTWAAGERGITATGICIRTGQPCIGRHLLTNPDVPELWRREAAARGFASVSAFPLKVDGGVIGSLTIYAVDPDAFDESEGGLLGELADDLAYGIATLRLRARHRQAEATIERMAFHDPLTGLPNRTLLETRLAEAIAAARQQNRPLALLMLDVDRFREVNEVIGYGRGDKLLQSLGERLRHVLDDHDVLAHFGRDEFAILLPQADANHATETAQRILKALEEPFDLSEFRVEVRLSIGIALFPGHGTEPELLILRADAAMDRAKRSHSGFAVFRGDKESENLRRLGLVGDLRRAIEDNQLLLHYQPKVDMRSGALEGAEALVRWQHPRLGMVPPDQFVPLAEHTGLIQPLTHWVLSSALGQSYAWHNAGLTTPIAVNLSMPNLRDPRLPGRISGIMTTWGAQPDWLQIEVTESSLMEDPAGTLEVLRRLDSMGIRLFVDDFGTGYSSLSYLQKLPIDAIKIDKSFVLGLPNDKDSQVIVRSTIDMAHDLGLKVVAEGVENRQIWDRLIEMECDVAQGAYVSEPVPVARFVEWHRQAA